MLTRRELFAAAGAGAFALGTHWARAKVRQVALPYGIGTQPDYAGPLPTRSLGTHPPITSESKAAKVILDGAPSAGKPIDVAKYFLALANGGRGKDLIPYASGWPTRWNPVIFEFFSATQTSPSGDITPWCAAFVNWCYQRSLGMPATRSASSGSFRCFGEPIDLPIEGDVVVFKKKGFDDQCDGEGHVGFFISQDASTVRLLGGNQIDGKTGCHSISMKSLPKNGSTLDFFGFRRSKIS